MTRTVIDNPSSATAPDPNLLTQIETADIPEVYQRFANVIDARRWTCRVNKMKAEIEGNPFLTDFLRHENDIAFGLERCGDLIERYGQLPRDLEAARMLYPAISFAAQTLSMMDLATHVEAERLRKRVEGALNNPKDMRALRLELIAATHFTRRGHRLEWPEMTGGGTFDLLVPDLGRCGLEVECKSISDDKGRNIHRREALAFHHLFASELETIRKNLSVGLAVVLTVPSKLPSRHDACKALAKRVRQQITIGRSGRLDDGSNVRIAEFDLAQLGNVANGHRPEVVREIIASVTGTQNREVMLLGTEKGGALAFVIQSAENDDLLGATFRTLRDAAQRQLTGNRPGILMAGFDGLDSEQLLSIARQDNDPRFQPTALKIKVSRFLSSHNRDHVVGVSFLSRSVLRPVADSIVESGGTAYHFPRRESLFWHDDFSGQFTPPASESE
ncbi:hypothetical protein [Cupriavidus sp. D39]|uniref:hypothetical protein n=1 Tax=Cupriavidus sp. D39 TaxID=2997877 RepID=UPI00226EEF21|nr:hypothetical protein [Cupriavidus sp. D39]MCY0853000.1 hypothetical protein [Cupriavidus sp. D39]